MHVTRRSHSPLHRQVLGLLGWVFVSFVAAAIGAVGSMNAGAFYAQLARPDWAPPGWLFAPVWTVLYLLLGVAAWLVWRVRGFAGARGALGLFVVQLAANALWTWLFFVWHRGALALAEIIVLWLLILATVIAFARIQVWAGLLLIPYLVWVSYAAALTVTVWRLNPGVLG